MIPFSLPHWIRYYSYWGIFVAAVLLHSALLPKISEFATGSPTLVTAATAGAIAWGLFWIFNRYIWKLPAILGYTFVPNFNGHWHGYIISRDSFQPNERDPNLFVRRTERLLPVSVTAEHTFTELMLGLRTYNPDAKRKKSDAVIEGEPESECVCASVDLSNPRRPLLKYAFELNDLIGYSEMTLAEQNGAALMHGIYFTNKQRIATMELLRSSSSTECIALSTIRLMPSPDQPKFVGATVRPENVRTCRKAMRYMLGKGTAEACEANLHKRNGAEAYHVTIVEPAEFQSLGSDDAERSDKVKELLGQLIWIECGKLGAARKGRDHTYYSIATAPLAQRLRSTLGLQPKSLHVTLGFNEADVHGVSKDASTIVRWPRLQRCKRYLTRPVA